MTAKKKKELSYQCRAAAIPKALLISDGSFSAVEAFVFSSNKVQIKDFAFYGLA